MIRFHSHLRDGATKDQALRAAQLELLQAPLRVLTPSGDFEEVDSSAPYYWAAFQLYGDWM